MLKLERLNSSGSVGAWVFMFVVAVLVVIVGGLTMDNISRGSAQSFSSQHCAAGEPFLPVAGVPCTGKKQDRGWPVLSNTVYSDLKTTNNSFAPSRYTRCYHGCSGGSVSYNMLILAGIAVVGFSSYKLYANRQLNRTLQQQSEEEQADQAARAAEEKPDFLDLPKSEESQEQPDTQKPEASHDQAATQKPSKDQQNQGYLDVQKLEEEQQAQQDQESEEDKGHDW